VGIVSLGYRTDLMLLALQGSVIEQRAGYQVIRTPANPEYHWEYALREMAARELVIVADPAGPAIRIYRSVGFRHAETQVQLQRAQPG
jgi:hypothetical protein